MAPEWIALIGVVITNLIALVTFWLKLYYQGKDLAHLEHSMNSMREQLVDAAGLAGEHKGARDERAREATREGGGRAVSDV